MTIKLYQTTSPNNKLIKDLGEPLELTGALRDGSSVIDPVITVEGENLSEYNYMTIPAFGNRKYFIKNITVETTGRWTISAHVDVLSTYSNAIWDSKGVIKRRGNGWNAYIEDEKIPVENRTMDVQILFDNSTGDMKDTNGKGCFPGADWTYFLCISGPGYDASPLPP